MAAVVYIRRQYGIHVGVSHIGHLSEPYEVEQVVDLVNTIHLAGRELVLAQHLMAFGIGLLSTEITVQEGFPDVVVGVVDFSQQGITLFDISGIGKVEGCGLQGFCLSHHLGIGALAFLDGLEEAGELLGQLHFLLVVGSSTSGLHQRAQLLVERQGVVGVCIGILH